MVKLMHKFVANYAASIANGKLGTQVQYKQYAKSFRAPQKNCIRPDLNSSTTCYWNRQSKIYWKPTVAIFPLSEKVKMSSLT